MASKILTSQSLKSTRGFAAQAAAKTKAVAGEATVGKEAVKTTTLGNGVVVASVETNAPLSRVGIAFRAGSRNEPVGGDGLAHTLRISSGLSTKKSTQFGITRSLQEAGAALSCTLGREHIVYSVDATRNHLDAALPKLADVATQPAFKPWELSDNVFRLQLDLASLQPQVKAVELLHKVAFRSGLGNSLFCPNHLVGKHSSAALQQFVAANLRADNATVVGVGVPHDKLVAYAQSLSLAAGKGNAKASTVHSGETRVETGGALTFVAAATAGASLANTKDVLVYALLQRVLGTGASTKRGANASSKLNQAVAGVLGDASGAVSALNLNYTDAGLFGFVAAAPAASAGQVVSAAVNALRSLNVDDAALARAKALLKADLLMAEESTGSLLEELSLQALFNNGKVIAVADLVTAIGRISADDVNAAASKVASGKLAMAAIGNLSSTPYLDEL